MIVAAGMQLYLEMRIHTSRSTIWPIHGRSANASRAVLVKSTPGDSGAALNPAFASWGRWRTVLLTGTRHIARASPIW